MMIVCKEAVVFFPFLNIFCERNIDRIQIIVIKEKHTDDFVVEMDEIRFQK